MFYVAHCAYSFSKKEQLPTLHILAHNVGSCSLKWEGMPYPWEGSRDARAGGVEHLDGLPVSPYLSGGDRGIRTQVFGCRFLILSTMSGGCQVSPGPAVRTLQRVVGVEKRKVLQAVLGPVYNQQVSAFRLPGIVKAKELAQGRLYRQSLREPESRLC